MLFYASFIVGFERLVARIFGEKYPEANIVRVLNGGILYKMPNEVGSTAPFLNNRFRVFAQAERVDIISFADSLDCSDLLESENKKGFRVIVSDGGELVGIDENVLHRLEKKIGSRTGNYVNRHNPDIEYWVLKRSEGVILFTERIGKHKSFDKVLEKGELREDLCYFLNYLSEPNGDDVYLDGFCGSGAIIKNRARLKFKMIFGIDTDKEHISKLRKVFKKRNDVVLKNIDFFENNFDDGFIDKIVTDPPWGFYEKIDDVDVFYQKIFGEVVRLLKSGGLFVLLAARRDEVGDIDASLKLLEKYDILVSGKKAGAYVFRKCAVGCAA